ncbi:hypothetical protein [Sulfitobacter sp.]|uniref:hypothetical protein n=1 Tax=Sulfitobacter sp. TaxID=1903071 RepID=UPI003F6D7FE0
MTERPDNKLIDRMPDGPLNDRELQETRYSNHETINRMVPPEQIEKWGERIDRLWLCLGWLPMTVMNWKPLGVALLIAILLGGQPLIEKISLFMETYMP